MKILFLDTTHPSLKIILQEHGFTCHEDYTSPKSVIENIISDYTGIILRSRFNIDKIFIDNFTTDHSLHPTNQQLKFIARVGAGMEHINVAYAESRMVKCISSPEGNRNAVAEHALGMLLNLLNNISKSNTELKAGKWLREPNRGTELEGKIVGIYGYGNTGAAFAKLLSGFDVRIFAYDKYKKNFGNGIVKESSPEEIFSHADILSLHLPLTRDTAYLVKDEFISKFQKNIYLINTSRGPIIKTDDLVNHLESGKISGACLDVLEYEEGSFELVKMLSNEQKPKALQYLLHTNRIILTPHIAGWSFESSKKMASILAEKILTLSQNK